MSGTKISPSKLSIWCGSGASEEMIESVVYRPRFLLGLGQSVEIVQDFCAAGIEIEIKLAATAELEKVQADPPPDEKPLVVDDQWHKTGIGDIIQPPFEVGPEVENCCQERFAETYNRPFRRLCSWAWLRTRARLSWEIS